MMKKFFFLSFFFLALFIIEQKTYAAEPDGKDFDPFPMAMPKLRLGDFVERDISLEGLRLFTITTSDARNLTAPWVGKLYTQLTVFLQKGGVLYVAGESYPLALRLATDCGERIIFYLDETLPPIGNETIFYVDKSLRHQDEVSSFPYPYTPHGKNDGPPLKEVGNAAVLVSADIWLSDEETRKLPVAISFRYGNGWVLYTSFQIEKTLETMEARNFARAIATLTYKISEIQY